MGTISVSVEIGDPRGERWERIEALVDTRASYTVVPAELLTRLGVEPSERRRFRTADDRALEMPMGSTMCRLDGRQMTTPVVFGVGGTHALLGAVTLEEFGLAPDPLGKRLRSCGRPTDGFRARDDLTSSALRPCPGCRGMRGRDSN